MYMEAPKKEVIDVPNEGLVALIGRSVLVMCANFYYQGKLEGVNKDCIKLSGTKIILETGKLGAQKWDKSAPSPNEDGIHYVMKDAIESFCDCYRESVSAF